LPPVEEIFENGDRRMIQKSKNDFDCRSVGPAQVAVRVDFEVFVRMGARRGFVVQMERIYDPLMSRVVGHLSNTLRPPGLRRSWEICDAGTKKIYSWLMQIAADASVSLGFELRPPVTNFRSSSGRSFGAVSVFVITDSFSRGFASPGFWMSMIDPSTYAHCSDCTRSIKVQG
jgi:hypothetical protein